MTTIDQAAVDELRTWIGRTETATDEVTAFLVRAYLATLYDRETEPKAGDPAPQGLHLCLGLGTAAQSKLARDGLPAVGDALPPVPLPRRMWAGNEIQFADDFRVGDTVEKRSEISDVAVKEGRTGTLCFVTVRHTYSTERGLALTDDQSIVYREAEARDRPPPPADEAPETEADATRVLEPTAPLLFRYSALTFNAHRIHYDYRYATGVEGYPSLVVHGPLQTALVIALAETMRAEARPRTASLRGLRPLFDTEPIVVKGKWTGENEADVWTGPSREAPFLLARFTW